MPLKFWYFVIWQFIVYEDKLIIIEINPILIFNISSKFEQNVEINFPAFEIIHLLTFLTSFHLTLCFLTSTASTLFNLTLHNLTNRPCIVYSARKNFFEVNDPKTSIYSKKYNTNHQRVFPKVKNPQDHQRAKIFFNKSILSLI